RIVIKKRSSGTVGKKNLGIDAIPIQRFRPFTGIIDFTWNFFPTLRIIVPFLRRRRAIAYIAMLNFAVDDPALHRKIEFFFSYLDDMRNSVAPFLFRHPARVSILAELAVGVGAD